MHLHHPLRHDAGSSDRTSLSNPVNLTVPPTSTSAPKHPRRPQRLLSCRLSILASASSRRARRTWFWVLRPTLLHDRPSRKWIAQMELALARRPLLPIGPSDSRTRNAASSIPASTRRNLTAPVSSSPAANPSNNPWMALRNLPSELEHR